MEIGCFFLPDYGSRFKSEIYMYDGLQREGGEERGDATLLIDKTFLCVTKAIASLLKHLENNNN